MIDKNKKRNFLGRNKSNKKDGNRDSLPRSGADISFIMENQIASTPESIAERRSRNAAKEGPIEDQKEGSRG